MQFVPDRRGQGAEGAAGDVGKVVFITTQGWLRLTSNSLKYSTSILLTILCAEKR